MFFNWRGAALVLAAIGVAVGLCALDLSCSGKPSGESTIARVKGELAAGRKERRNLEAENLAKLARDMRVLAQRYLEKGDKRKAQRAIGAAQELDRKIQALTEEKGSNE